MNGPEQTLPWSHSWTAVWEPRRRVCNIICLAWLTLQLFSEPPLFMAFENELSPHLSLIYLLLTSEVNGKPNHEPRKERSRKRGGGGGRFEPYGNPSKRYRVFVSNIPYDVKWQALKDLMKEKGKCRAIVGLRSPEWMSDQAWPCWSPVMDTALGLIYL